MIRQIAILFIVFCLFSLGCSIHPDQNRIPEGYSKLTVAVDESPNFYLDKVLVINESSELKPIQKYDTIRKEFVYVFDSLRNDKYEMRLTSLLNKSLNFPLTLVKDTVITIHKSKFQNFDTAASAISLLSDLQSTDTLCIAYKSRGCFHNYSNKTLIYKTKNGFTAEFSSDTSHDMMFQQILTIKRQLPMSFIDTLKKLEIGCMEGLSRQREIKKRRDKGLSKAKNAIDSMKAYIGYWSTTSSAIYLNKGNKVFELTSEDIIEIPYYYRFMRALELE